jgi:hypothetical protein
MTLTSVVIDNIHDFIPLKYKIRLVIDPTRVLEGMTL